MRTRTAVVLLAALFGGADRALAQRAQWSDAVYLPGRWSAGHFVPLVTRNPQPDSLALAFRVDYFSAPPRWRAELRRNANGQSLADQPDVLIGNGATVVVLTPVGATPLEQHALGHDALVLAAREVFDAAGRRRGAASGQIVERASNGMVARVVFRRPTRSAAFDDALLN
ncbi:MAG: hypothetical protein ACHQU1_06905, partial [Gemmatimonadales bacterium]